MIGLTLKKGYLDMEAEYRDGLRSSIILSILSEKNSSWVAGEMNLGNEYGFIKVENMGKMKRNFLESLDWMTKDGLAKEIEVDLEVEGQSMTVYIDIELNDGEKKRINFYFKNNVLQTEDE